MKFELCDNSQILGGGLKGYFDESYNILVSLFGEPNNGPSSDNKVLCEWTFKINDELGWIYNYKTGINYVDSGLKKEEIETWHIGGKSSKIVDLIRQYCIEKGYLFLNRIIND